MIGVSAVIEKVCGLGGNRKRVFRTSTIFGNIGFMGISLVIVLYPDTALLYVSVFTIVDQLVFWTYGVVLTQPASEEKQDFSPARLKNLISPPLVAIVLAVVLILLNVKLPAVLSSALSTVGSTSMPLALIYIGGVLCSTNIKPVLKCKELYACVAVKMLLLPILCYAVLTRCGIAVDLAGTLAFIIALPGIEMVPMLAKENGCDGDYAVGAIMLTTIASLLTIPLVSLGISFL